MEAKPPLSEKEREKLLQASSKSMSNEERTELMKKLEEDLDAYIKQAKQNDIGEKDDRSVDEIVAELKQHPAFTDEIDFSKPLSKEMEGLMTLKYESEDTTANAESFKEEGNYEFKKKSYRVAVENYTAGIKCCCPNKDLNAILYTNRAAAQFYLGNFRSSIQDSLMARKFKPDHMKAILRGATCCLELKKSEDAVKWCDAGLLLEPKHEKLLQMRLKAEKLMKSQVKDGRKESAKERKTDLEERKLLKTIQSRGITLAGIKTAGAEKLDPLLLTSLESRHPGGGKVCIDDDGTLHWPIMFLYPEHTETDYIQSCDENIRLIDHINHMFGPDMEAAPWDLEKKYKPDSLEIYFEDCDDERLYEIEKYNTLLQCLQHKKYTVRGGTPTFILLVRGSKFQKIFRSRYKT